MTVRSERLKRISLAFGWTRPYGELEIYRLGVGPFYSGEVYRHPDHGYTLINALLGKAARRATLQAAQHALENWVQEECRRRLIDAPVDPASVLADAVRAE